MRGRSTDEYFRAHCREQNRDISEKIALGLAKPTTSKESMYDSRLFNREANQASMGDSGSYNVYDKPLFNAQNAAAAIYRPRGNNRNDEAFGGGTEEGISNALENDRFGLGASKFVGAAEAGKEDRSGPVEFEKDVSLNMGQVQGDSTSSWGMPLPERSVGWILRGRSSMSWTRAHIRIVELILRVSSLPALRPASVYDRTSVTGIATLSDFDVALYRFQPVSSYYTIECF
jgi:hypothetical protein